MDETKQKKIARHYRSLLLFFFYSFHSLKKNFFFWPNPMNNQLSNNEKYEITFRSWWQEKKGLGRKFFFGFVLFSFRKSWLLLLADNNN